MRSSPGYVEDVVLDAEDDVVVVVDEVLVVVGGGGPVDTAMSTELPGDTVAPVPGFEDTTRPAWNWVDVTEVTLPRLSPALPRA